MKFILPFSKAHFTATSCCLAEDPINLEVRSTCFGDLLWVIDPGKGGKVAPLGLAEIQGFLSHHFSHENSKFRGYTPFSSAPFYIWFFVSPIMSLLKTHEPPINWALGKPMVAASRTCVLQARLCICHCKCSRSLVSCGSWLQSVGENSETLGTEWVS